MVEWSLFWGKSLFWEKGKSDHMVIPPPPLLGNARILREWGRNLSLKGTIFLNPSFIQLEFPVEKDFVSNKRGWLVGFV